MLHMYLFYLQHVKDNGQHVLHQEPSVTQRLEEAAPSTSGISTTTKRNREEICPEQVNRCEKI